MIVIDMDMPKSCRECSLKQDCGFKYREHNRTPHCNNCLIKCDIKDIKAEIEQLTSRYSISKERGGMGQVEWSDRLIKESDVLQIIDKYKAQTE